MQCKSCGTELPKKAKVCPKCGELVGKQKSDNLKVIAVAGLVIALIGGLLPFVQNTDVELISDAYSFMNIDVPAMWYLYMLAIVVSLVLLAVKKDMFSIIPTAISGIITNNIRCSTDLRIVFNVFLIYFLDDAGHLIDIG